MLEERPYAGLFVLDAGQGVAGPYCGMLLAACGADVVKLEPPEGDWSRGLSTRQGSQSVMHAVFNRGKRSVILDLRTPEGRAASARLAARADVLIESFRPGVAARLGLGPEATGPNAICLSISGFGQSGPYAERPCTDSVAQAFGGLMFANRDEDGAPRKVGILASDMATGLHGFAAVQAALAGRWRDAAEGRPARRRVLDVSLMAGTAAMLGFPIAEAGLLGRPPEALNIPAGCYECADGGWLAIALVREAEFRALCSVLGLEDLPSDPRFADFPSRARHRSALLPGIRAAFRAHSVGDWLTRFAAARIMAERANGPNDWLADPHVLAVDGAPVRDQPGLGPMPFPRLPGLPEPIGPAPALGEHTAEVMAGFAEA
ncbi:CoA transferase [Roseomonas sp. SSH11]|uniref:CoA transferase n=1 Tax=Pararoseomonas baculiformis TaxID=2820812 RepID=A0ABS4ALF9_9PROT|nr:CoA transferase [Pararoseomonas baculiformis]MBP0447869.1 CoA transferase [Pararoseomonas baculiformis]